MRTLAHQKLGTQKLIENPFFALFDEMGVGKTKQVIDAAEELFKKDIIDKVVVICPAAVRSVWFNEEFGELKKWLENTPSIVMEYHKGYRKWSVGNESKRLIWIITNYDYIRNQKKQFLPLLKYCSQKTLLVLDESSSIKSYKTKQTKACMKLRKACGRVVLLNGTPIANNPMDLFTQGNIMHLKILDCPSYIHFRSRYAIMGGYMGKKIVDWVNLKDLQRRFAPYVLRRLKSECMDLPEKLDPVTLSIPLDEKTWAIYKEMKTEMIAWLSEQQYSQAPQAIVRVMRLSQITSGYLGGVENGDNPVEIGREKLIFFSGWLTEQLKKDPNLKVLVWFRFQAELFRMYEHLMLADQFLHVKVGKIVGGQKQSERDDALRLFEPRTAPEGPAIVLGIPKAGGLGLNLAASNIVFYISRDYDMKSYLQSKDRVHRPGQTRVVSYFDVVATGPNGQKTVDHTILKAHHKKENLAIMTTSAWIKELEEE
jgi:SNF2 family DNA or RNA helicase